MAHGAVAAGLVLGCLLDEVLGDPRRGHPVAVYGRAVGVLERCCYADSRRAGAAFVLVAVLPVVAGGRLLERVLSGRVGAHVALVAAATWVTLGGRGLRCTAADIGQALDRGDVPDARTEIAALCGREPDSLDEHGLARAVVESVAENTSDAVVAPLCWGAVAGVAGLLGYRAVNTLDAMVGHRCRQYARFGAAAARLDDLVNLGPARLTGALTLLAARAGGGEARAGWRVWRCDAGGHPSPNAGVCEAAAAGVLGVRLGGETVYRGLVEQRPMLGDGREPEPGDIARAVRLSRAVQFVTAVTAAALAVGVRSGVRCWLPARVRTRVRAC